MKKGLMNKIVELVKLKKFDEARTVAEELLALFEKAHSPLLAGALVSLVDSGALRLDVSKGVMITKTPEESVAHATRQCSDLFPAEAR